MSAPQSRDLSRFNLVASVALSALGLLALFYLIPIHIPLPEGLDQGLSARFMPNLAATVLTGLALLLGGSVVLRMIRGLPPLAEDNEENDVQGFGWQECINALILLGGSAVYVVLLQSLGFVAASSIALAVCLFFGGVRNWLLLAVVSIGLPVALSQILWHALSIIMPPFPYSF